MSPTLVSIPARGGAAARPVQLPEASPPDAVAGLAGEYIGLTLIGGVMLGLIVGLALPARRAKTRGESA